ncbi:MAG: hybrid sensor histidine kinase/response regulator, partial [Proteobacteria bacterium]|nr:hybrid sensor histidine kinase/response regulator [Pseudomonadota bacterium]
PSSTLSTSAAFTAAVFWITFLVLAGDKGTLAWAVLVHGMQLHMYFHLHREQPQDYRVEQAFEIRRRLETRMLFPGVVWALAPWLFFPGDSLPLILLMYFFVSTMTSASAAALAQWWRAAVLFTVPCYLSLSARLLLEGDTLPTLMGFLALWQMLATLYYTRKQNRLLVRAIESGFENARLADALSRQLDHVAQLAAQRARIFAAANHDLRQPMHALSMFVASLSPSQPPQPQTLRFMQDSVDALRTSVDALLDIAQSDGEGTKVRLHAVPLAPLLQALHGRFAADAAAKGLRLRLVPTQAVLHADARVLSRLLADLVDNAIKYTPRGTVLVAARRRRIEGREAWRIEVRDSGLGIAESLREQVFEPFFQADNPGRDRRRGLGLGLSLVASMARMLHSRIELRSEPGRGSTFSLTLPAARASKAAAAQARVAANDAGDLPKRVLVLDDEEPVRLAMHALLRGWGHEVALAAHPHEAWQLPGDFDLLLGDLRLGSGLSGLAAAQALHAVGKVRQVVILTGETDTAHRTEVELAGFPILYKPADAQALRAVLAGGAAAA